MAAEDAFGGCAQTERYSAEYGDIMPVCTADEREYAEDLRDRDGNPEGPYVKRLTLDIALFFMALHGYSEEEAARELNMDVQELRELLDKQKESPKYAELWAYYTAEKEKRALRRRRG